MYIVADDQAARQFLVGLDETMRFFGDPLHMTTDERRYAERMVRQRLHQPVFRARVMHAFVTTCAVCSLKHADLLDAAHIIADTDVNGLARVTNGIALCKSTTPPTTATCSASRPTTRCGSTPTC